PMTSGAVSIDKRDARKQLGIKAEKVILFFGYIRKYKGLHVLLDAMNTLKSSGIHLLAVGECYDDEQQYRDKIEAMQLQDSVSLHTDYIPNDKVGLYFSAADLVILPYLSATQSGITQIAYNFDRPVIATAVGGLAEVVLDNATGFIVPPNNAVALAQSIMRFYEEKKEEAFTANVRQEKKKYTWEAMVRVIEEMVGR
ncbi:MAG: glycosyltransferase, partial [Bacteroidota bacterium]